MGIRIAVLASGRGSNLVAIMQAIAEKKIDGEIAVVLSDKQEKNLPRRFHTSTFMRYNRYRCSRFCTISEC